MTTDWTPALTDIAAMREARRNGNLRGLLRQSIADGKARLESAPATRWPVSGKCSDVGGITCPHCSAGPGQRCHLKTRDKTLAAPHPQRVALWARTVACCPTCQATPGKPCHLDGMPLPGDAVHAARYQEAEVTAA
ncbi:hypothetical protein MUK60_07645 [Streptomyces sp. LRE541]|uniref:zinc finger domain-containing protein n=1 Tax=Streptomyces sp. LRE541 TaxID=2931983 RepID=UPI00200E58B3|nr:hypothetical protein [Streptomyces sp. LRE541]UPZ27707.1 hypothetical protein MUK60_07645 [Streptomyces sp. LRE541]